MEKNIEEKERINCEKNVKIYKMYKMFAYDWLFYYAVQVLYLTTIKGFTVSQIMFLSSIYAFSAFLSQLSAGIIVNKFNNKKCIVFGNFLQVIACTIYIVSTNFNSLIIGQLICAFGFALKGVAEGNLLYGSLKRIDKADRFSKVEGTANSRYYYLEAICGVIAGYLFTINGYLPMIMCLFTLSIALSISIGFKDYIPSNIETNEDGEYIKGISIKEYIHGIKKVLKSSRAKAIFLFAFIFYGIIAVSLILYKSILIDLGFDAKIIAIIASCHSILVGIGTKSLYYIERETKNHTLTVFSVQYIVSMFIIGFVSISGTTNIYNVVGIYTCLFIMAIIQGAYRVAIKKYVVSFTNGEIRTKMISLYYLFEAIGQSIILFLGGIVLKYHTSSVADMLIAIISLSVIILVLLYIDSKLGLKPDEYEPKDIYKE